MQCKIIEFKNSRVPVFFKEIINTRLNKDFVFTEIREDAVVFSANEKEKANEYLLSLPMCECLEVRDFEILD